MKIRFLGTGTSCGVPRIGCQCEVCTSKDPRDFRLRCSALVRYDDTNILLDCGPDFRLQMLRAHFISPIHAVFITHEHYDHVGGIDDLRPFSYLQDVPLYADDYAARHLRERLPYCLVRNQYPGIPQLRLHVIAPGDTVDVNGIPVTAFRVIHGELPILGYRVGDIAYITDMTCMPHESMPVLSGIRLLVVNALRHEPHPTHQSLEQAIAFRRSISGNFPTWLIHMADQIGLHARQDSLLPEGFHLAYDGLELEIPMQ
ncbi:MAG: MBL fold metallo-hydrolase [Bacteroidaceae bacterium]